MKQLLLASFIALSFSAYAEGDSDGKSNEKSQAEQSKKDGEQQAAPKEFKVQLAKVGSKSNVFKQNLPGRVAAYRTAEVRSRVEGIVEKRVFEEGSIVNQGDVLFYIEKDKIQAEVDAAKANVENAQAAYNLSLVTLGRYKRLLKMGAVSQQDHDNYEAQTKQLKATVSQAEAELNRNKVNIGYTQVLAPITGRIDKALVTEGALVTAGGTTLLAEIEQLDKVYIDFTRSETESRNLEEALGLNNAEALESKEIDINFSDGRSAGKGVMEFISRKVDPTTGAVSLRATVENPHNVLLPGMYVRVTIPVVKATDLTVVTTKAIHFENNKPFVYQIKDKKIVKTPVKTAGFLEQDTIITDGLKPGEEVVISDTSVAVKMQDTGVPIVGEFESQSGASKDNTNKE